MWATVLAPAWATWKAHAVHWWALVGAGMVYGLATKDKVKAMRGMRQMMEKFQKRNGATQCKLLKGAGTGKPLRECADCVADASEFLEELLTNEGK